MLNNIFWASEKPIDNKKNLWQKDGPRNVVAAKSNQIDLGWHADFGSWNQYKYLPHWQFIGGRQISSRIPGITAANSHSGLSLLIDSPCPFRRSPLFLSGPWMSTVVLCFFVPEYRFMSFFTKMLIRNKAKMHSVHSLSILEFIGQFPWIITTSTLHEEKKMYRFVFPSTFS